MPFNSTVRSFESLASCVLWLQNLNKNHEFVFRGERTNKFETTSHTLGRVQNSNKLSGRNKEYIVDLSNQLCDEIAKFFELDEVNARGFVQHYEMPTTMFDVTYDPCIAASFAAQGIVGSVGLVGVFPIGGLNDIGTLSDLRHHEKAHRPKVQKAGAFNTEDKIDLKNESFLKSTRSFWVEFSLTVQDKYQYSNIDKLLNTHEDLTAGFLYLCIDERGEFNDRLARWLANTVTPGLVVLNSHGKLVSAAEANIKFDEGVLRENKYRI